MLSPLSGLIEYVLVNTEMISVRMWFSHTCRLQRRWPVRTNAGGQGDTAQLWPIGMVNRTPLSKA